MNELGAGSESIRYNFLQYFKTDYIIIDMILGTVIATILTRILTLQDNYLKKINNWWKNWYWSNRYELSLNCIETRSPYGSNKLYMNGSVSFKAMLFFLKTHLKKGQLSGLYHIREFCCYDDDYDLKEEETDSNNITQETIYISNQTETFQINNSKYQDLIFRMEKEPIEQSDKDRGLMGSQTLYTLSISTNRDSSKKSLNRLQSVVDESKMIYQEEMNRILHQKQFVFVYEGKRENQPDFTVYPFQTTVSMDTLFFDQKKEVLTQIDFFRDKKSWYEQRGKPYTLGLCSYGIPGCGKTTFEKAVASYLNRHMIIVDFSKIKTSQEADQIFFSETINDLHIPYEKRLYVFPDIDRMCDLITGQKKTSDKIDPNMITPELLMSLKNMTDKDHHPNSENFSLRKNSNESKEHSFSLSKLLNILDGIPERTGQVIMMSANHPEKIDHALLRPGRIDILLEFKPARLQDLFSIVYQQFDINLDRIDQQLIERYQSLDRKWTPAEIFQICSRYYSITNPKEAINQVLNNLMTLSPEQVRNPF